MVCRQLAVACVLWAFAGLFIASAGVASVNDDARLLVFGATVVGVGAALLAANLLVRDRPRWAGLCLVVSVVTPTWSAAVLNLVPLIAGLILLGHGLPSNPRSPGLNPPDPP